ncbi:MAG: hypothetical protein AB7I18_05820 [Candidatus Berkiella sp.]
MKQQIPYAILANVFLIASSGAQQSPAPPVNPDAAMQEQEVQRQPRYERSEAGPRDLPGPKPSNTLKHDFKEKPINAANVPDPHPEPEPTSPTAPPPQLHPQPQPAPTMEQAPVQSVPGKEHAEPKN